MRKRKRIWFALLAMWMLIGLSFSLNDYLSRNITEEFKDETLWSLLRWDAIYWPLWAGLAWLLIFRVARRFPLVHRGRAWNLLITVAIGLGFTFLHRVIYFFLMELFLWKQLNPWLLLYNLPLGFMSFCVILLADYAFSKRDAAKLAQKDLQLSLVKAQLKETQLQALRIQLQPHFIQNTLGSVLALMPEDVEAAHDVLTRLGEFLSVSSSEKTDVTLGEELDCLRRYVEIEKITLEDRLEDSYEVDPETRSAQVPNLILQPIIENAIKHGVRPVSSRVRVVVSARLEGGKLCLRIKDNGGNWSDNSSGYKERVGVRNTRERLKSACGPEGRFDLQRTPDGWTVATIEMPFIKAAEPPNAEVLG